MHMLHHHTTRYLQSTIRLGLRGIALRVVLLSSSLYCYTLLEALHIRCLSAYYHLTFLSKHSHRILPTVWSGDSCLSTYLVNDSGSYLIALKS